MLAETLVWAEATVMSAGNTRMVMKMERMRIGPPGQDHAVRDPVVR
jgi:hypothetical protein